MFRYLCILHNKETWSNYISLKFFHTNTFYFMNEWTRERGSHWIGLTWKKLYTFKYKKEKTPFNHLIVFDMQDVNLIKQPKHLFCNPKNFNISPNLKEMFYSVIYYVFVENDLSVKRMVNLNLSTCRETIIS